MKVKYKHTIKTHNTEAAKIILPDIMKLIKPKSVVDVGCGIGTWLKVFKDLGVEKVIGIDGDYVDRSLLMIDPDEFITHDLEKEFSDERRFDLAVCLEVAEHISLNSADKLIKTLTSLSDTIIFSAAISFQGGDNHVNEQWPQYRGSKFHCYGYKLYDFFRETHWDNEKVEWWYSQNMFLFSKQVLSINPCKKTNNYIHPKLYEKKQREIDRFYYGEYPVSVGIKFLLKTFRNIFMKKN